MFGKNPLLKKDQGFGDTLRIVKGSPWLTIQGEGPYVGHPAVFIRLHGCNLACTFCDTQFSNPDDPVVHVLDIVGQVVLMTTGGGPGHLIVITGGEPMRQNIRRLCGEFFRIGYTTQIETAGTLWVDNIFNFAQIVCSPKTPIIHPEVLRHAVAFKYVIDVDMTFDRYVPITATQESARPARLALPRAGAPVYLSPMDCYDADRNAANRKLVGQLAIRYGCIAGVQLHKMMELD